MLSIRAALLSLRRLSIFSLTTFCCSSAGRLLALAMSRSSSSMCLILAWFTGRL